MASTHVTTTGTLVLSPSATAMKPRTGALSNASNKVAWTFRIATHASAMNAPNQAPTSVAATLDSAPTRCPVHRDRPNPSASSRPAKAAPAADDTRKSGASGRCRAKSPPTACIAIPTLRPAHMMAKAHPRRIALKTGITAFPFWTDAPRCADNCAGDVQQSRGICANRLRHGAPSPCPFPLYVAPRTARLSGARFLC